jgi:hypothetical protein
MKPTRGSWTHCLKRLWQRQGSTGVLSQRCSHHWHAARIVLPSSILQPVKSTSRPGCTLKLSAASTERCA